MAVTKRYVFLCDPADQATEAAAFFKAQQLTDSGRLPLTYLAPNVRHFGAFDFAINAAHIKKLIRRDLADLAKGAEEIVTVETIKPYRVRGVLLGLRCIPEAIAKMDECIYADHVVFVSFYVEEGLAWARRHGAEVVLNTCQR